MRPIRKPGTPVVAVTTPAHVSVEPEETSAGIPTGWDLVTIDLGDVGRVEVTLMAGSGQRFIDQGEVIFHPSPGTWPLVDGILASGGIIT